MRLRLLISLALLVLVATLTFFALQPATEPASANPLNGVTSISAGGFHTCAVTTGGGVQCWGRNNFGQLGNGTTTSTTVPVSVCQTFNTKTLQCTQLLTGVAGVSAGGEYTCAVTTTNVFKCWGKNDRGQVGDGTVSTRTTPVDVLTGVTAFSAGTLHTCAVVGGGIKCWGYAAVGQLGDGVNCLSNVCSILSPAVVCATGATAPCVAGVNSLTLMSGVAVGSAHTCGLTIAGTVKCWGQNFFGTLGAISSELCGAPANRACSTKPLDVTGLSGVGVLKAGGQSLLCSNRRNGRRQVLGLEPERAARRQQGVQYDLLPYPCGPSRSVERELLS